MFVDRKVQRLYAWLRLGDEIVQASVKAGGTCKEDVTGSSPVGGAISTDFFGFPSLDILHL